MTLSEAINACLTILKQVMEEKLNSSNVEVVTVTPEKLYHLFTKEEVEAVRKSLHFKPPLSLHESCIT